MDWMRVLGVVLAGLAVLGGVAVWGTVVYYTAWAAAKGWKEGGK